MKLIILIVKFEFKQNNFMFKSRYVTGFLELG